MLSNLDCPILLLGWRPGGGRSGTVGGTSPGCFSWVLPQRSISKPDQHGKDIIQRESLGNDVIGTDEQQLHNITY